MVSDHIPFRAEAYEMGQLRLGRAWLDCRRRGQKSEGQSYPGTEWGRRGIGRTGCKWKAKVFWVWLLGEGCRRGQHVVTL
ncbi:unnamed protein product [Chondrus crispus]|uniref:Uncharacterized protein n=1 Tax=Chondrus crispus TaxID=2769 RepID=R7Q9N6_CHOCR|nr:unnamed protein product [Chondrus crispus]CDF34096.1 unnamed protein product [Chondrus crispus]|eukprot:XP_005713915.1 unnamed protein product [Chondrus crispus]